MPTTVGSMDPPLGNTRLQTSRLLASLLLTNTNPINAEIANLGTITILVVSAYILVFLLIWIEWGLTNISHIFKAVILNTFYKDGTYTCSTMLTLSDIS